MELFVSLKQDIQYDLINFLGFLDGKSNSMK
jgi:hypothetical protein